MLQVTSHNYYFNTYESNTVQINKNNNLIVKLFYWNEIHTYFITKHNFWLIYWKNTAKHSSTANLTTKDFLFHGFEVSREFTIQFCLICFLLLVINVTAQLGETPALDWQSLRW